MAFDKIGFTSWLKESPFQAAAEKYVYQLELLEKHGHLSLDDYVPQRTDALLQLLELPIGLFHDYLELRDLRQLVRHYRDYVSQRDHAAGPAPAGGAALAPPSRFMQGVALLQGKFYVAPDAFSPFEYPEERAN